MTESTEVARKLPYGHTELRNITSFADAKAMVTEALGGITLIADVLGDGFELMKDKSRLVNIPFLIMNYTNVENDKGEKYSVIRIITLNDEKFIITDGGSGIYAQMLELESMGVLGGIAVNGVRSSEYLVTEGPDKGKTATTYYLNV